MDGKTYDVIIIGGAPAGLTAAIYTCRRALKTLIITKDIGGQAALTAEIENYPGVDLIDGFSLMQKFKKGAENFGAEILTNEAIGIEKEKSLFKVKTKDKEFKTKTVILSFGLVTRELAVPGEEELKNKGVSYCATCDGPLFKDKIVAVVGGGNSALEAAEYLSNICQKIYLIHRRDEFRGESVLVDKVKKMDNIEMVLNSQVKEIKGENAVKSILIEEKSGNRKEINVDGIFIEIGYEAKTGFVKDLVELDEKGQIKVDKDCRTSAKGIFAAGDVTDVNYKQLVISAGQGATAALSAAKYIQENI